VYFSEYKSQLFQNLLRRGLYCEAAYMSIFHGNKGCQMLVFQTQNAILILTSL